MDRDIWHFTESFINPWKKIIYKNFYNNPKELLWIIQNNKILPYSGEKLFSLTNELNNKFIALGLKKHQSIYIKGEKSLLTYLFLLLCLLEDYVLFIGDPEVDIKYTLLNIQPMWICSLKELESLQNNFEVECIYFLEEKIYIYKNDKNPFIHSEYQIFIPSCGITKDRDWIGFTNSQILNILKQYNNFIKEYLYLYSVLPWHHSLGIFMEVLLSIYKPLYLIINQQKISISTSVIMEFIKNHIIDILFIFSHHLNYFSKKEILEFKDLEIGIISGILQPDFLDLLRNTKFRVGYYISEIGSFIFLGNPGEFEKHYIGEMFSNNIKMDFLENSELIVSSELLSSVKIKNGQLILRNKDSWYNTGDIIFKKENKYYFFGRKRFFIKLNERDWFNPYELEEFIKYKYNTKNVIIYSSTSYIVIVLEKELSILQDEIFVFIKEYFDSKHMNCHFKIIFLDNSYFFSNFKGEIHRLKVIEYLKYLNDHYDKKLLKT